MALLVVKDGVKKPERALKKQVVTLLVRKDGVKKSRRVEKA